MNILNVAYVRYEPDKADDHLLPEIEDMKTLRTVTLHDLQSMAIPERDMLLSPIIPAKGLVMAFAQRGIGKTFLGLNIAYAVASGVNFCAGTHHRQNQFCISTVKCQRAPFKSG